MGSTVTVEITIAINGGEKKTTFPNLEAKDARFLAEHLIEHALMKINQMMPDDPEAVVGGNRVTATYMTIRDSDGQVLGTQANVWPMLDDAGVGALQGQFDAAMAKLDKRIASKGKKGK